MKAPDKKALDGMDSRLAEIEKERSTYENMIQQFNIDLGRRAYEHEYLPNANKNDISENKLSFYKELYPKQIIEVEGVKLPCDWNACRNTLIESARTDKRVLEVGFTAEEYTNAVVKFCKLLYVVKRLKGESVKLQPNIDYNYTVVEDDGTNIGVSIRFTEDELIKLTRYIHPNSS
ncbi:MAG: hypothetical protein WBQ25_22735 [Nitrososphaeraceae archaeon]